MSTVLYLLAITLFLGWILGFFIYKAEPLIHALLVLAVVAVVFLRIGKKAT